ncbi:transcriptional regulator [Kibdelosporangium philippinense]|uniref:Transcriptional regulator n=1 Tax=Kibdelosporangium philippinense TaxID=211113 RepID=A0ABS8ZQA0_9PSEU|nr:BTAD domain-containing putative transcriptional regulator [Kibdelosporangium philippinense]MCE7009934.1 transcriptional regulator [Kibdelosporangium philippinense]
MRILRGLIAATILLGLVAGLPWALWYYVGWPLPDHMPTWVEIETLLLSPMTATFLLDFLACLCWPIWAAFVIDVVRCAVQAIQVGVHALRWPHVSARRPMHALAAVLIAAIMLSVVGKRTAPTAAHTFSITGDTGMVVATATARPDVSTVASTRTVVAPEARTNFAQTATPRSVVVRARDPQTGVYDSLSRIAERTLGTQTRWPDIFELNKGKPQPNGKPFTNPHLVFPGEELTLPPDAAAPVALQPDPPPPPIPAAPPHTTTAPTPPPEPTHAPAASPTHEPAVAWELELFVGLGLAAAVSTALLVARRRRNSRYQPGSGRRDDIDLPVAPVVYQLQLAHLQASQDEFELDNVEQIPEPHNTSLEHKLGVRDGREIALDLAAARGLGLIGAGASAAARALLLTALATSTTLNVLVPADDLPLLLGHSAARAQLPHRLRLVDNLDAALDELEADILTCARDHAWDCRPRVVLVAQPQLHNVQRLQAVLDNGAAFGIIGVLLGQWQAGVTAYVREDGTISATSPGRGEALRGTHMFQIGSDHTTHLLDLLQQAQRESPVEDNAVLTTETGLEVTAANNVGGDVPNAVEAVDAPPAEEPRPVAATAIRLSVLGKPRVFWRPPAADEEKDITGAFQPRQRELLVFLGLHPEGATRESLTAALWANSTPDKTTNAMNTALSRLRTAFTKATNDTLADIVITREGTYRLDADVVDVDYWHFDRAITRRRMAAATQGRIAAYRAVVNSYTGPLADGMSTEWIESAREAIRRDALDAVAALARALVDDDPEQTLDLLETARAFDPYNELLYRDIMRLQERLGRLDAIPRTLALLTTRLAELGDQPTPHAISLATRLQQRHEESLSRGLGVEVRQP